MLFLFFLFEFFANAQTNEQRSLILVIGAAGEAEYAAQFSAEADLWKQAAAKGGMQTVIVGQNESKTNDDKNILLQALSAEISKPAGELWLVFVGHGTFDGRTANFNLRGPDISADELAVALKPCQRPLVVVNCASSSGPFLPALAGPGRVVITATRSGYEQSVTRFGDHLAHAVGNPSADLDKDGQTSLLEAFLMASRQTADFYKEQGRLMTEHALLDDNGDGLGTPPDWFRGVRAAKTATGGKSVDGVRAHQMMLVRSDAEQKLSPEIRAQRDALEQQLSALRSRKTEMQEEDYYRELEALFLAMVRLHQPR